MRRRVYANPGPNAVWQLDGCGKLASYGIYIHGCIDGFSRKIIWMHAYCINKHPAIVACYYFQAIDDLGHCPMMIRADCGTENGTICEIQRALRRDDNDARAGDKSFMYGKSTSNQRIEWYWMNVLQSLKDDGVFSGDELDKGLSQYCFTDMVQVCRTILHLAIMLVHVVFQCKPRTIQTPCHTANRA